MLTGKLAHFRRPGLTPVRRPASPVRPFALFQQVLLEGLMAAVQLQLLAALQAKVLKILLRGDRRTAEALKQPAQYLHAQRGGSRPVDQRKRLQLGTLLLQVAVTQGLFDPGRIEHLRRCRVQNVEMIATGERIKAVLLKQLGKHDMQQADREDIGTQAAGTDGQDRKSTRLNSS